MRPEQSGTVAEMPTMETGRLRLWRVPIVPDPSQQHEPRDHWFGVRTDTDCPMAVVHATVWPGDVFGDGCVGYLELIETSALHRREGLASEMLRALQAHYGGELSASPATPEGEAWCEAMEREKADTTKGAAHGDDPAGH